LNQLFICADDVDFIGEDIDPLQSNTEVLVEACNEIDLQVNIEKAKYMKEKIHLLTNYWKEYSIKTLFVSNVLLDFMYKGSLFLVTIILFWNAPCH